VKLRSLSNGWTGEAEVIVGRSAPSFGRPVLVVDGEPLGAFEAFIAGYRLVEGTNEEHACSGREGTSRPWGSTAKAENTLHLPGKPLGRPCRGTF
jgi:hypothetical protein